MSVYPSAFDRFRRRTGERGLTLSDCERLEPLGRLLHADRETPLALDEREGQLVYVDCGAVKLVARASGHREQVVAFHFAGDLVHVPARGPHAYVLVGLGRCSALAFPLARVVTGAHEMPRVLRCLLEASLVSLTRCREKSVALGRKTAAERLAGFLCQMGQRIGRPDGDAVTMTLPMSRRDIADSLGLTIETVSRQFTRLREAGLIETRGRSGVRLRDWAALGARAGYLPPAG